MENDKCFNDWRVIDGVWHYIEHFPYASQMGSFCQKYKPYGLFDKVSKKIPSTGEICSICKQAYDNNVLQPTPKGAAQNSLFN